MGARAPAYYGVSAGFQEVLDMVDRTPATLVAALEPAVERA